MLSSIGSLLSLAVITLAAYALGRPVVWALGVARGERLVQAVWGLAVGWVLGGQLLALCGLVGLVYSVPISLVTWSLALGALWGIFSRHARRDGQRGWPNSATSSAGGADESCSLRPPDARLAAAGVAAAGLACLGSLLAALAPPTAGDALCYHLELPKTFLAEGAIRFLPDHENGTFPLLVEMWYLWGLAVGGPVTAQLIHWECGVLLGLATVVLARPIVGRQWAWLAGAAVLVTPGVCNQMAAPLNDVALALLTTLALAAWWRAVAAGENRRWFVLAGLAAGGALATKYVAIVFLAAAAVTAIWMWWRRADQRGLIVQGAAVVGLVGLSVAGLWYVRAAWYRGNPVYPFLAEVWAGEQEGGVRRPSFPDSKLPLGRNPLGLIIAPWQATMHPERFGGRGHQLGVFWLAAVPGLVFTRRLRGLEVLVGTALSYAVLWYLLRQNVRFLFPIVPLLSVAAIWVWIETGRFPRLARAVVVTGFLLTLTAYGAIGLARCKEQLAVALGVEQREQYLARHEPTWVAASILNAQAGRDAHLLTQDYRAFYFRCRVTREALYRRRTGYQGQITEPSRLSRQLRAAGFTHLLLAENLSDRGIQYDPTLARLVQAEWSTGGAESLVKLAEYLFWDSDGAVRRYQLIQIR